MGHRIPHKLVAAVGLAAAVVVSLWFTSPVPVTAVEATLPSFPTSMYVNHLHTFYAQVDIDTNEMIPVNDLRLAIDGPTPVYATFNADGSITAQSGHFVSIVPVVTPRYDYGDRYGYGYGYQAPMGYKYVSQFWGYGYGYGYGYGGPAATTQLKFLVTFNTTGMSTGSYTAQLSVNTGPGADKFVSSEYSFNLTAAPAGGGGGGGEVQMTGSVNLANFLNPAGETTASISLSSPDGKVIIFIPVGTKLLDAAGNPLGNIIIIVLSTPAPPPGYELVRPAYECKPDGAVFEVPITLTFTYDESNIPEGCSEDNLVMALWDGEKWTPLVSTINPTANTVTAKVSHFTVFAILAKIPPSPAALTASDLSISPAEADTGEKITISIVVTNSGELTGSYEVTFKINDKAVATKEVELDGGASEPVTFTTIRNIAGTYTVDVNGLTDTFVVREVTAPEPTPEPTPPVVPPPAPAANWWLIGGILAAITAVSVNVWRFRRRRRS